MYSSDANVNGSYSVGTTVSYECDVNYRLIGVKSQVCESDKEWNGTTPVCESKFCICMSVYVLAMHKVTTLIGVA